MCVLFSLKGASLRAPPSAPAKPKAMTDSVIEAPEEEAPVPPPARRQPVPPSTRTASPPPGGMWQEFERLFAERHQVSHALATTSCTAALHLALLGSDVGPDTEVIIPAQTFVATATAVLMAGGTPVFADIQPGCPNIAPDDIERRITKRTRSIIVVHYGGYPCDMDDICANKERAMYRPFTIVFFILLTLAALAEIGYLTFG